MIIVKLIGGLGNQMAQYAFGRTLSQKLNTPLYFDKRQLGNNKNRKVENFTSNDLLLDKYKVPFLNFASEEAINEIINIPLLQKIVNRVKPFYKRHFVSEQTQNFDPNYLNSTDNTYFEGFWISEGYFIHIRPLLLKELGLKKTLTGKNLECKKLMEGTNSVAVHIRRGDFVSNEQINKIHGTVGLGYYNRAINFFEQKIVEPKYFFFSDDVTWVQQYLPLKDAVYIDWNGTQMPECDLRLMTYAKHNIIANSTFSWWGAWLNQNEDKIIIAPSCWYASLKKEKQAGGIVPNAWIRL